MGKNHASQYANFGSLLIIIYTFCYNTSGNLLKLYYSSTPDYPDTSIQILQYLLQIVSLVSKLIHVVI